MMAKPVQPRKHLFPAFFQWLLKRYPKSHQEQFVEEMESVFLSRWDEMAQASVMKQVIFMIKEVDGIIQDICDQYLYTLPLNGTRSLLTSSLLTINLMLFFFFSFGIFSSAITLFLIFLIGLISYDLISTLLGLNTSVTAKIVCGLGFVLVSQMCNLIYLRFFEVYMSGANGNPLVVVLYPVITGMSLGIVIALSFKRIVYLPRLSASLGLLFGAGFLTNRLSAALLQSYITCTTTQALDNIWGWIFFIILPILIQGLLFLLLLEKVRVIRPISD